MAHFFPALQSLRSRLLNRKGTSKPRASNLSNRKLTVEVLEARKVFAGMLISEIQEDPLFGNRDADQYIELQGIPNATVPAGTYFAALESWGAVPGGPGYLHSVIDLSNLTFGSNGFLTITQFGSPYQVDPASARLMSTSNAFAGLPDGRWSDASAISDRLAHVGGSLSFLLITSASKPVPGTDYDSNDDGTLDGTAASWTTHDSVAMLGYTPSPGWSYGRISFSHFTTDHRVAPGSVLVVQENVGYVARIGNSTGYAASDWVAGTTIQDELNANSKYRFTYGTFGDPRPLVYSGRATNHLGTYNFGGGFSGFVGLDIDRNGQITGSDTPQSGVTLFADRNDNGVRDLTTINVIASQQPLNVEIANAFPNATLTVADSNNKNIGFAVKTVNTFDNNFDTIRVFSSEGIPWYDSTDRLKVMFYREAQEVSIEAIAASSSTASFGRISIFDKNDNLLATKVSRPLIGMDREVIGLTRPNADIKYAIIYTDDTISGSSPFGPFDKLRYSYPEFQTTTGANGIFTIGELPPSIPVPPPAPNTPPELYRLTVANYPGNLIPLASNTNYPLTVNRFENLTNITLGYKTNLLPDIQSTQFNIPENPPLNTVLATVLATDPDEGQTLTYRFSSNPGPFSIDVLTGQIRYTGNGAWDYETTRELNAEVEVRDSLSIPGVTRKTIKLVNLDRNEAPSVESSTFTIDENSPPSTLVGSVVASDPDAGVNGQLSYFLGATAPAGVFTIDESTGQLRVFASAMLDYEARFSLTVPIVVRDKATPSLSSTGSVTVLLRDVNEAPTNIGFTDLTSVSETTPVFQPLTVAAVQVTDDALGTNQLSLSGADASFFSLVGNNLRFQSALPLDFETKSSYSVLVSADDATIGANPDISVLFTLQVSDVNEKPTGVNFTNVLNPLLETTDVSTAIRVATIAAQDDAIGNNVFSLANSLDSSFFQIVGNELRFRSATPLDYETKSSYRVVVQVDDGAFPGIPDASSSFTLTIGDVNEPPSDLRFLNPVTLINETNSTSAGQVVATIAVTDDSVGSNVFTLEGPDAASFEIIGSNLRLKSGTLLDFEVKPFYDVTVRVTDPELPGSPTLTRSLRVNVRNRPEIVSMTDSLGAPLAERVRNIRLNWDAELNTIGFDAISVVKKDVDFLPVTTSVERLLIDGKTTLDLTFSGNLTDAQGYLIDGVYEVFVNGSRVTAAGTGASGLSFNSGLISVLNPLPPATLVVSGKSLLHAGESATYNVQLSGLVNPPNIIQYEIDIDGNGTTDRNLSGSTSLSIPNVSYANSGSYALKVVAKSNGAVLGLTQYVIDVTPARSNAENWLSAMDTDRDDSISPLDVLNVINQINIGSGAYKLDCDVDRDGIISPLDVLNVINYINTPPAGQVLPLSNLVMAESGGNQAITADRSVSGRILNSSRTLFASLNGGDRLDVSQYVAPDGSFAINDQAITELFGILSDGQQMISLSVKSGNTFLPSSDKRFLNLTQYLSPFSILSLVGREGKLRASWSESASGARYNLLAGPVGTSLTPIRTAISGTSVQLGLEPGLYEIQIEAVDAAGNTMRSEKRTVTV